MSEISLSQDSPVIIISIDRPPVSKRTQEAIEQWASWIDADQILEEDLYSEDIADRDGDWSEDVLKELEEIRELCSRHNASYFRLVKV